MEIKMNASGEPIEQDTYDWGYMRMFRDFVATASPEIREAMKRSLEQAVDCDSRNTGVIGHVDWRYAVDLGDKYDGWGRNFLYVWLDGHGCPFYVGQGENTSRPGQFKYKTRSDEFQKVIREGGCHSVVVAKHIPRPKIDDLETELIAYLCWKGYPLVNASGRPSAVECKMARRLADATKLDLEEVFLSETEYDREFQAISSVLNKVIGSVWDGECAVFENSCRA